jgi:hypothetical protein
MWVSMPRIAMACGSSAEEDGERDRTADWTSGVHIEKSVLSTCARVFILEASSSSRSRFSSLQVSPSLARSWVVATTGMLRI